MNSKWGAYQWVENPRLPTTYLVVLSLTNTILKQHLDSRDFPRLARVDHRLLVVLVSPFWVGLANMATWRSWPKRSTNLPMHSSRLNCLVHFSGTLAPLQLHEGRQLPLAHCRSPSKKIPSKPHGVAFAFFSCRQLVRHRCCRFGVAQVPFSWKHS